jgi:hypothetical protein
MRFSIAVATMLVVVVGLLAFVLVHHPEVKQPVQQAMVAQAPLTAPVPTAPPASNSTNQLAQFQKLKRRSATLNAAEKEQFLANFNARYKPAIDNWCQAFANRVPFDPTAIGPDQFVERVGIDPAQYSEYVFVVDGVTLGVEDSKGVAKVDYLNAPQQTKKLSMPPDGSHSPSTLPPLNAQDVAQMLKADSGVGYPPSQIRIIPSGLSGALDGGAFVNVGGDPNRGATWKYDMVFGPDGKLAYFLRGAR